MRAIHSKAKLAIPIAVLLMASAAAVFCTDRPSESPIELVRRTVQREIAAGNGDTKTIFVDRKETPHGSQTKLIVETCEGMAGMHIIEGNFGNV